MNKISKRIVALATMAAFVLTLVPAAAFAADADYQTSYFLTSKSKVEVNVNEAVDLQFEINDASGNTPATSDLSPVTLWATDEQNRVTTAATFYTEGGAQVTKAQAVADNAKYTVKFARTGDYTIHAGLGSDVEEAEKHELNYVDGQQIIKVSAAETSAVDSLAISAATQESDDNNKIWNATNAIKPNSTATQTHTVTAYAKGVLARNESFDISTSSKNISVSAKDMNGNAFEAGSATTDRNGQFKIVYSVSKPGDYKIYLTAEDGYKVTLNVTTTDIDKYAADIEAANLDKTLDKDSLKNSEDAVYLSDAVQFDITDNNGNLLENSSLVSVEPAAQDPTAENAAIKADYVKVLAAPNDKISGVNFTLAWDPTEEVYTLKYAAGASALVEGKYTIRVALEETGNYADATFTIGEYGTTQSIKIDVADEVVAGDNLKGKVVGVDENGIEKILDNTQYSLSVSGKALSAKVDPVTEGYSFEYKTWPDIFGLREVVGTKINVLAISEELGKMDTAEVTVVAEPNVAGLEFDTDNGPADQENTVVATVVDENGNTVKTATGEVYAYVADQGNADANVEVNVLTDNANKGVAKISIYSDIETTVDVVVAVTDADGTIYADTLSYTVGAADVNADKLVAMTIGSSDYIVDNDVVAGDAAPYIDSAWRTMVPIRALAETFGATVDFKDNVITIVDGDTTIVMTVGETAYTVNDEEANMDTAPVIGEGDRTFVPVRFVAEALGYTVTPLQDANGLTASVVFQK